MRILRRKVVTFADLLPDGLWDEICAAGSSRGYSDGQLIQERGEKRIGLSLVNSGQVAAGNVDEGGVFLASALLREGECFGEFTLFLDLPRSHGVWAVGDTRVTFVSRERFERLLEEHPSIYQALLKLALWRNHEILSFLDAQRRLSLSARIIQLLLSAPDDELAAGVIQCRHEDLGLMLGVSRVAIGKALKKLQADGLVRIGYGTIELLEAEELRSLLESERRGVPRQRLRSS